MREGRRWGARFIGESPPPGLLEARPPGVSMSGVIERPGRMCQPPAARSESCGDAHTRAE